MLLLGGPGHEHDCCPPEVAEEVADALERFDLALLGRLNAYQESLGNSMPRSPKMEWNN